MKIKMLYETPGMAMHMVVKTEDGRLMKFFITPARHIEEKDLSPIPFYRPQGRNAREAAPYMYSMYGFEKEA